MRDSTIIYRSFYEAILELPPEDQALVWKAIFEFSLNFKKIELSGYAKMVFTLIKPQLEANILKYKNGKKGGRPAKATKQTESESKPKNNQNESESKGNGNDKGNVNLNNNPNIKEEGELEVKKFEDFIPPSESEVINFFIENNLDLDTIEKRGKKFWLHFESLKWNKIKNWEARAKIWIQGDKDSENISNNYQNKKENGNNNSRIPTNEEIFEQANGAEYLS